MTMYTKRPVYTWSGKHFGYRKGTLLFTHRGVEVGYFNDDDNVIYGKDGLYLGELKSERLVTDQSRRTPRRRGSIARVDRDRADAIDCLSPFPPDGFEDFSDPDDFS